MMHLADHLFRLLLVISIGVIHCISYAHALASEVCRLSMRYRDRSGLSCWRL